MGQIIYKRVSGPARVIEYVSQRLTEHLGRGQKVLWLVPGGSAMSIALGVAKKISDRPNLDLLNITLTDERHGPLGHHDSNWKQLMDMGFSLKRAQLMPVLSGKNLIDTAAGYKKSLDNALAHSGYSLALAGMGPDGHIFGIKPASPAIDSPLDISAYDWDDYRRITPTIHFLKKLDEIVLYAVGDEKHPQFDLLEKKLSASQQPAQLLKQLKQVTIFNDYKGEEI